QRSARVVLITAYLSLGSNLGDREANLQGAIEQLHPVRLSPIYETEPVDYTDQPEFLNLAVELKTALAPEALLAWMQEIEHDLGRVREIPKGPRTIDIDILFYGDQVITLPNLEIPHPRLPARRFVLAPLADIAPDLRHPVTGWTVLEMLSVVGEEPRVRLWTR